MNLFIPLNETVQGYLGKGNFSTILHRLTDGESLQLFVPISSNTTRFCGLGAYEPEDNCYRKSERRRR
jgi:hypothetical protein